MSLRIQGLILVTSLAVSVPMAQAGQASPSQDKVDACVSRFGGDAIAAHKIQHLLAFITVGWLQCRNENPRATELYNQYRGAKSLWPVTTGSQDALIAAFKKCGLPGTNTFDFYQTELANTCSQKEPRFHESFCKKFMDNAQELANEPTPEIYRALAEKNDGYCADLSVAKKPSEKSRVPAVEKHK